MSRAPSKRQKTLGLKQKRQDPKLSLDESDSDMKNLMGDLPPSDSVTIPKSNSPLFKISVMQNFDASFDSDDEDNLSSEVDKDLEEYMKQNGAKKKRIATEKKKANQESLRINVMKSRSGRVVKPKVFDDELAGKKGNKAGKAAEPKATNKKKNVKAKPETEESSEEEAEEESNQKNTRATNVATEEDKEGEMKAEVPELRRSRPGRVIKPKKMDDFVFGRVEKQTKEIQKKKPAVEAESDDDSNVNKSKESAKGRGRPKKDEPVSPSPQKLGKVAGKTRRDAEVVSKAEKPSEKESSLPAKRGRARKNEPEEETSAPNKPNASTEKKGKVVIEKPAPVKTLKKGGASKPNSEIQSKKEETIEQKVVIPLKRVNPTMQKTTEANQQKKEGPPKPLQMTQAKVQSGTQKVALKPGKKEIILSDTEKLVRLSEAEPDEVPPKKLLTQTKKAVVIRQIQNPSPTVGVVQPNQSNKQVAIRKIIVKQPDTGGLVGQLQKTIQINKPLTQLTKISMNTSDLGQKKIVSVPQGSIFVKKDGVILRRVAVSDVKGKMPISPPGSSSNPITLPQGITISKQSMVTSTPIIKQGSKVSIVRKVLPQNMVSPIRLKAASSLSDQSPVKIQSSVATLKKISNVKPDGTVATAASGTEPSKSPVFVPVDIGSILSKSNENKLTARSVSVKSTTSGLSQTSASSSETKPGNSEASSKSAATNFDTVRAQRAREITFLKKRLKELEMLQEIDDKAAAAAKRKLESDAEVQANVKRLKKVTQSVEVQKTQSITPSAEKPATMDTDDPLG